MALFGDKNKQTIEELENYYSNRQQRAGMAWFMAFLSLVVTVVVLGGLFFGGRFLYKTFVNDDVTPTEVADSGESTTDSTPKTQGAQTEKQPETTPTTDSQTNTDGGVVSEQAARTETPNTSAQSSSATQTAQSQTLGQTTPVTGDLPNTGANMFLIATPIVVLFAAYIASLRRQFKNIRQRA